MQTASHQAAQASRVECIGPESMRESSFEEASAPLFQQLFLPTHCFAYQAHVLLLSVALVCLMCRWQVYRFLKLPYPVSWRFCGIGDRWCCRKCKKPQADIGLFFSLPKRLLYPQGCFFCGRLLERLQR